MLPFLNITYKIEKKNLFLFRYVNCLIHFIRFYKHLIANYELRFVLKKKKKI